MKRISALLVPCLLFFVLVVSLAGCGQPKEEAKKPEAPKVITLNLGSPWAEGLRSLTDWDNYFAQEVEKRSNGRVKIKIHWAEALGKTADLPQLLASGGMDMTVIVPSYYPAKFPLAMVTNQMFFVNKDLDEAFAAANAVYFNSPVVQEFAKNKMKVMFVSVLPPYQMWSWEPMPTLASMKGKKLRSWGPYLPKIYETAGAVGVNLLVPEWYEGMEKKMVHGGLYGLEMAMSSKVNEVAKYVNMVDFGVNSGPTMVMNTDVWNKLPDDIKKVFEDVMKDMPAKGREIILKYDKETLDKLPSLGVTIVPFKDRDKLISQLPDFRAQWLEEMKGKGMGAEAAEIIKVWDEAKAKVAKK